MGPTKNIKFRIIVIVLLMLITYQTYKLYPKVPSIPILNDSSLEIKTEEVKTPEKVVHVEVFYEALCPDSRHFFIHHLAEVFPKMKNDIKLSMIPYGKAKTIESSDGMINFECQHGELECQANKVHACSIEFVPEPTDQLSLVNCMIKDNMDPDQALTNCASALSIDTAQITECVKSAKGDLLLKVHGQATDVVKPKFIPTILIDGSKDNQGIILKNFKSELCKHYSGFKIPELCV